MAGDWLKFDCGLPEKPETMAITAAMGWDDTDLAVGKLMRLFRWFDQHTVDGNAASVTPALLDRVIGVSGFVQAVAKVGWIVITPAGVTLQKFEKHNGASAKKRAQTAERVAKHRETGADLDDPRNAASNAPSVTPALAREEKRREEEKDIQPPAVVAAERLPACPATEIVALYHEHLPMLPAVAVLNDGRKRAIGARWREVCSSEQFDRAKGLEWFAWFFGHAAKSRFLTGRAPGSDWRADFDFLMTASKFAKVIEGSYHKDAA